MSQQRGYDSLLLAVQEATFGTSPGDGTPRPILTHTLRKIDNPANIDAVTGRRDRLPPVEGPVRIEGDIVVPLDTVHLGTWLMCAFGQTSSPWRVQDDVASFQLQENLPAVSKSVRYNGLRVRRLRLAIDPAENPMTMTLGCVGVAETVEANITSPGTPAALTPIRGAHWALSEGGVACGVCTRLELHVDFGLDDMVYPIGGGGQGTEILGGLVTVHGTMRCLLSDDTLWAKARAQTETSLEATASIGPTTVTVTLDEVHLGQPTKDLQGPGGRLLEFPYRAYFADADPDQTSLQVAIATV